MLVEFLTGFLQGIFFGCMIISVAMIVSYLVHDRKRNDD